MLTTCFVFCALALRAGDVVVLPPQAAPVAPGGLNWVLRDARIAVAPRTRAIVLRLAPEGLAGVAEVRLFDGTDRLAWLAADDLSPIRPPTPAAGPANRRSTSTSTSSSAPIGRPARVSGGQPRRRRPDFRRVDAAIASMMQAALAAAAADPPGRMVIVSLPVFPIPIIPVAEVMAIPALPVWQAPIIPVGVLLATPGMPVF